MTEIIVVGYPRSGNTLLSWLLGDTLNCPVGGMYDAKPLATEGLNRPKKHHVYQLHLRPEWDGDHKKAIPNALCLYVPLWSEDEYKICCAVRDPRDVVVSTKYYWQRPSIQDALDIVGQGLKPLRSHLAWSEGIRRWMKVGVPFVRYEDLLDDAAPIIRNLLQLWDIDYEEERLAGAIERQSFAKKKEQIEGDHRQRPYHKGIYRVHLRKGIAGDWRNHFTPEQEEQAQEYFGEMAAHLGYKL